MVAAAAQHAAVHNHQASNTQASALGHAGWSPTVGAMAAQGHHTVVTDHSTLAYMSHAYQSNNSSVNDHRNSSGPMAHQPIGTGPQASSYAVDSLYNSPSAAAAVAAYGYSSYNAAFFQTSNNGPHSQSGHPSAAGLSAFWNPNQNAQQRTGHSQGVSNQQASMQQQRQQQITSDQASSYIQDPRMYYGRPPYGQFMQNLGQHQPHSTQQQQQSDLSHNRMSNLTQQQLLMQQHPDQQLQQFDNHQALSAQQSQLGQQQTSVIGTTAQSNSNPQHNSLNEPTANPIITPSQGQHGKKAQSPRVSPQQSIQKLPSAEVDNLSSLKGQLDYDQLPGKKGAQPSAVIQRNTQSVDHKDLDMNELKSSQSNSGKDSIKQSSLSSNPPVNKLQAVTKNEPDAQLQPRKLHANNVSQPPSRNVYRASQDDRNKTQAGDMSKKPIGESEWRSSTTQDVKNPTQTTNKPIPEPEQSSSLNDSMASLAISSRKTTWASIASQPAKVAQPKSLKSKIAGSNSVLSSAKHLASSVTLDASSLDSKNGINPAIKSSVSTAATSMPRGSVPPPIAKVASVAAASLKLDLLGDGTTESSKISWPAVNASINLSLEEPPAKKESPNASSLLNSSYGERQRGEDGTRRDASYKDHNHNQGGGDSKMVNNYQHPHGARDDRHDDFWSTRRDQRDQREPYRVRRDSDRKDMDDKRMVNDDLRNNPPQRRDYKAGARLNHFRGDEPNYRERDNKRGAIMDRNEHRGNDNFRYPQNRYEHPRDLHQNMTSPPHHAGSNRRGEHENSPHHHYSNLRDGNSARGPQNKLDLSLHPHLNPINYNPKGFDCEPENARYFIIKSYSEDDIHRSIKYSIWCSTNHGNKRLDEAYRQQQAKNGQLFLFFSVNGSGHFCGMAQMTSAVDFDSSSGVWAQSKWQGEFSVKWIYVKDVPNSALRHITLENNEDKPVTNSRDTQEVPSEKGKLVLKIIHQFSHTTSLFDDFLHYERRQEEEKMKKSHSEQQPPVGRQDDRDRGRYNRPYNNPRIHNEFQDRPRDRLSRYVS